MPEQSRKMKADEAYKLLKGHYDPEQWTVSKRSGRTLASAIHYGKAHEITVEVLITGMVRWKVETMATNCTPAGVVLDKSQVSKGFHHDLHERLLEADRRLLVSLDKGYTLYAEGNLSDPGK